MGGLQSTFTIQLAVCSCLSSFGNFDHVSGFLIFALKAKAGHVGGAKEL
jgi:hypothetical protein